MATDSGRVIAGRGERAYPLPSLPIERRERLSRGEFEAEHLSGLGRPVIVTDATASWAAPAKWTFDFFRQQYGDERVLVTDRLGKATVGRNVRLSEYLLYAEYPFLSPLAKVDSPRPLYLTSFSPFARHPELLADFEEPYFVDNAYRDLQGALREWYFDQFTWVFMGPAGTLSPLHVDLFATHAWLAQTQGRKHFLLFSPADAACLYDGAVDLEKPDLERHPLLERARPIEAVLAPGEVIFIPRGWAHEVVSLDPAISVTFNFVERSNFMAHVMAICRELPLWARKIDKPGFREANGMTWTAADLQAKPSAPDGPA
jgi:hypothetical protein